MTHAVYFVYPRSDLQALYGEADLLGASLTTLSNPPPKSELDRIKKICGEMLKRVETVRENGWVVTSMPDEDRRLQRYVLTLTGLHCVKLTPYRNGYRFFSPGNPMDEVTREILITLNAVRSALAALQGLRDPLPIAAVVSLPPKPSCCIIQ